MEYTPAYLTSGAALETNPTVWAALTNTGSFKQSINGEAYDNITPDFSGVTTMEQVAAAIQTAIRAKTTKQEICEYDSENTKLIIRSADKTYESSISVCSAATVGVDISGETYMDCGENAVVTPVSAVNGMSVEDIYQAVAAEIFNDSDDTSLDQNFFRKHLNDGYRIVRDRVYGLDPNFDMKHGELFNIVAEVGKQEAEFSLDTYAPNCVTIIRVDYLPNSTTYTDKRIPIPETEYDEKIVKTGIRYCRQGNKIFFRGIYNNVDNLQIHFLSRLTSLIAGTDRPVFPNNDYHSILVDYIVAKYYKRENMETDWRPYLGDADNPKSGAGFYGRLEDMLNALTPVDEPKKLHCEYEDGLPAHLPFY